MMTNEEVLQKMQEECNLRNLSHWTLKEYLSKSYVMIEHFAPNPLANITDDELRIFLIYLRDERKLTPSSVNVYSTYYKIWKPQTDEGWLFTTKYGNKISGRAIQDVMRVRLKLAGLSHKPYTPHTLRHNFATAMLNGGSDVCVIKKLLGHTHIQSTTFYLHLADFEEGLESPLDRLNKKKKDGESND